MQFTYSSSSRLSCSTFPAITPRPLIRPYSKPAATFRSAVALRIGVSQWARLEYLERVAGRKRKASPTASARSETSTKADKRETSSSSSWFGLWTLWRLAKRTRVMQAFISQDEVMLQSVDSPFNARPANW